MKCRTANLYDGGVALLVFITLVYVFLAVLVLLFSEPIANDAAANWQKNVENVDGLVYVSLDE